MSALSSLTVLHLSYAKADTSARAADLTESFPFSKADFVFKSCQRRIWVSMDPFFPQFLDAVMPGLEVYRGSDAYRFLLQVAAGLESEMKGETEIFGQLKAAWAQQRSACLESVMQRVFEDTKDIRSRYLQNLGAHSYGSIARRILKEFQNIHSPVLLLGAGKLARAVAPFLTDRELWIHNRSTERLIELVETIPSERRAMTRIRCLNSVEEEQAAWNEVFLAVVCIPADPEKDAARVERFAGMHKGAVLHMGINRRDIAGSAWEKIPNLYTLDDFFELQKASGSVRFDQIALAQKACLERALLRSLGPSTTIPHGWEDLAIFAS